MPEFSPTTLTVHATMIVPVEAAIYFTPGAVSQSFHRLDDGKEAYQIKNLSKREREIAKTLLRVSLEELEKLDD